jgi:protein phosphatase PTC7
MADMPSAAQRFSIEVEIGDIVVAATDGVFDNVYPDEAAAMVTVAKKNGDSPELAATLLAQFARTRAADPTHLSPFAYGAQQLGYKFFGGKMDDITVVCAYIGGGGGGGEKET